MLLTLAMGAPLMAQGTPDIFVGSLTPVGKAGAPGVLDNLLATELFNKYKCANVLTTGDVAALVALAKDQQTLGTPEDQQVKLETIGDAMGRAGTLVFGSFGESGGEKFVNVKAIDGHTGKVVENTRVGNDGDKRTFADLVDEAVGQMRLSVCEPRWTGTVTILARTSKREESSRAEGPAMAIGTRSAQETTTFTTEVTDETTFAVKGQDQGSPAARVVRVYRSEMVNHFETTMQVDCRPLTGMHPPDWRPWRSTGEIRIVAEGRASESGHISVSISSNGRYEITAFAPEVMTKGGIEKKGDSPPKPCDPNETATESIASADRMQGEQHKMEGTVDAKDPKVLSGKTEIDNKDLGEVLTMTWQLKREDAPPALRK